MIKINKITRGRFGNRVLQYNSAYQLSKLLNTDLFCVQWEGFKFFDNLYTCQDNSSRKQKTVRWTDLPPFSNKHWNSVELLHDEFDLAIDDPAYVLHNAFFHITTIHPRTFIKIKQEYIPQLPNDSINVGIHFRGDDIISADGNAGREIHTDSYYTRSIELIDKEHPESKKRYFLCTDDIKFDTFIKVIEYMDNRGLEYYMGPATLQQDKVNHFFDFSLLAFCDILIASSSTYAVAAGFLGKEKSVIHSKDWLQKNIDHMPWWPSPRIADGFTRRQQLSFDDFWVKVAAGGNNFYNAWRII
jgi:hypothetical protein